MPNATLVTHKNLPVRFVLTDCPRKDTMPEYVQTVRTFSEDTCETVVRLCEATAYDKAALAAASGGRLAVDDSLKLPDGGVPTAQQVTRWRQIVCDAAATATAAPLPAIAVHCVSGIGRAPVFIAVSLIDYGMDPFDAVEHVRRLRRGALNKAQVRFLVDRAFPRAKSSQLRPSLVADSSGSSVASGGSARRRLGSILRSLFVSG